MYLVKIIYISGISLDLAGAIFLAYEVIYSKRKIQEINTYKDELLRLENNYNMWQAGVWEKTAGYWNWLNEEDKKSMDEVNATYQRKNQS